MKLTTGFVRWYARGQMQIQNPYKGYIYRGEVATIVVEANELRTTFAWMAKGVGYPPIPQKWTKDDKQDFVASLERCLVHYTNIGCLDIGVEDITRLYWSDGENIALYPPLGSKLDPATVEGLVLA